VTVLRSVTYGKEKCDVQNTWTKLKEKKKRKKKKRKKEKKKEKKILS
jgi:hypothetical protein